MDAVRKKFHDVGLKTYDCLAPGLMDAISDYTAHKAGTAYSDRHFGEQTTTKPAPKDTNPTGAASAKPLSAPVKKQGGIGGFFSRLFGG